MQTIRREQGYAIDSLSRGEPRPDPYSHHCLHRRHHPDPVLESVWLGSLPADLKWESNNADPVYADPAAKRGGTFRGFVTSFPLTLRKFGPDSNGSFASYVRESNLPLLSTHPVTGNPMPMLANAWAFGADHKTLYFRINPKARWSDGKPVTADDWVFPSR